MYQVNITRKIPKSIFLTIKLIAFFSMLTLSSCGQSNNSNSNDEGQSVTPSSNQAISYLQNRCISCHGSWRNYTDLNDYERAGLVVSGDPDNSILVQRLKNTGGDMPQGAAAIPTSEYTAIRNWISNP